MSCGVLELCIAAMVCVKTSNLAGFLNKRSVIAENVLTKSVIVVTGVVIPGVRFTNIDST